MLSDKYIIREQISIHFLTLAPLILVTNED